MLEILADFRGNIPSYIRSLILVIGLVNLWIIEGIIPRRALIPSRTKHAITNLFFTCTILLINLILGYRLLWSSYLTLSHEYGLSHLFVLHWLIEFLMVLFLLDFIGA